MLFVLSSSGCSEQQNPHHAQLFVFGTTVDISIYPNQTQESNHHANATLAIQQLEQTFQQFHTDWHAWQPGGIVDKINQAIAQQVAIPVSPQVKNFIIKTQHLSQQSDYLFDPAIGTLIQLWGFHSETWQGPPPSEQQIQNWLKERPTIADIYFQGNRLHSNNPSVQLDFGGNAKGLALDIAIDSLKHSGIENAIVSIGGDMKAIGSKNGTPWRIGIQNPNNPQHVIASLSLNNNESVFTSGTYQRFFEWQGKRYAHIINPNTGYPADSFASVTVLHEDAITADSAATALLIAGPAQWQTIAEQMKIDAVFAIDTQGKTYLTDAMKKRLDTHNR